MEFWLIKDGEKEGPILDFELRSRIRSGEVSAEQKVWHADLDDWIPIGEAELFANEFKSELIGEENVGKYLAGLEEEESATPPPFPVEPVQIHLWRRFGARYFDYFGYMMVFFLMVVVFDLELKAMGENPWFPFVLVLPLLFIETTLLTYWGTTPGKWLTGLTVRGADERKLSGGAAFLRTMRVMILGMGFGQPILREICNLIALWFAVKKKVVIWDTPVGIRLRRLPDAAAKWVTFGLGIFFFMMVTGFASIQILYKEGTPEEKAKIEEAFAPFKSL